MWERFHWRCQSYHGCFVGVRFEQWLEDNLNVAPGVELLVEVRVLRFDFRIELKVEVRLLDRFEFWNLKFEALRYKLGGDEIFQQIFFSYLSSSFTLRGLRIRNQCLNFKTHWTLTLISEGMRNLLAMGWLVTYIQSCVLPATFGVRRDITSTSWIQEIKKNIKNWRPSSMYKDLRRNACNRWVASLDRPIRGSEPGYGRYF